MDPTQPGPSSKVDCTKRPKFEDICNQIRGPPADRPLPRLRFAELYKRLRQPQAVKEKTPKRRVVIVDEATSLEGKDAPQDTEDGAVETMGGRESLNTEMIYYSATLKESMDRLSNPLERSQARLWAERLFSPTFFTESKKIHRNKYLLHLTISVLNDELSPNFSDHPSDRETIDSEDLLNSCRPCLSPARWEVDDFWELLTEHGACAQPVRCRVHLECSANMDDKHEEQKEVGGLLDQEFKFFLYLLRPYAALLPKPEQKAKVVAWIKTLSRIGPCTCLYMKGIRNDYAQALLGYLQDLRVWGPFQHPPPDPLIPLAEAAIRFNNQTKKEFQCPLESTFLAEQPTPDEGAVCYMAITGDLDFESMVPSML